MIPADATQKIAMRTQSFIEPQPREFIATYSFLRGLKLSRSCDANQASLIGSLIPPRIRLLLTWAWGSATRQVPDIVRTPYHKTSTQYAQFR